MEATTGIVTITILLMAFVVSVLSTVTVRARRERIVLRQLPAYTLLPQWTSEALESDRPLHFSFGGSGLGSASTPLTLANAETFTLLARRATVGTQTPLMTMSDAGTLPLGYDVLRRAYRARGRVDLFRLGAVQWYPDGARSLAFAAALTGIAADRRVSGHVLLGSYGSELALILDAAARRGQHTIAASDQIEGQAVAFAMADEPVIGEEMFAAPAYLGGGAAQMGSVIALDVLRIGLILALGVLALYHLISSGALAGLLGGGG